MANDALIFEQNMDSKKLIHVLIKIIAAIALIVAIIVILVNKGIIEFVVPGSEEKVPNPNFSIAEAESDSQVVDEGIIDRDSDVDESKHTSAGIGSALSGKLDIESDGEEAQDDDYEIKIGSDFKTEFNNFLSGFRDTRGAISAKGIYVTDKAAGSREVLDELIELADNTQINTMVIDVKNDIGEISFDANVKSKYNILSEKNYIDNVTEMIQRLHDNDIYCVARIVAFKDPLLAEAKPEWSLHNNDGSVYYDSQGVAWVNPYNTEVWKYIYHVSEAAVDAGFDEIQYDYIRFSTGSGMDFVDFGEDARFVAKSDAIAQFLAGAYMRLAPKGAFVGADIFGTAISSESDGKLIGQDFIELAGYCDYICPMIYPSHFAEGSYGIDVPDANPHDTVYAVMSHAMEQYLNTMDDEVNPRLAKFRPWLQGFTASWLDEYVDYEGRHVRSQIRGLNDLGIDDWFVWNGANNYDAVIDGIIEYN